MVREEKYPKGKGLQGTNGKGENQETSQKDKIP
jgi:hypothetical protein